jgi:glycosyltransferase involved in cell wall biosynthesis
MWSRRGFPLRLLLILGLLMIRGVRLIVVFHDSNAYPGTRPVDRLRRACQVFIMRSAYRLSVASILGVPLESASWLAAKPLKASFIPIGANVPYVAGPMGIRREPEQSQEGHPTAKTIAVFGVTDGGNTSREVADIVFVAKAAAERLGRVRLVTLGRGSCESEHQFRQALNGCGVEYRALGILPPEEVASVLSGSDVSLFVRGHISTQRSTAIASIACALPLVGYADACLPGPLAEAGVVGVPCGDRDALAEAAVRVMSDPQLDADLRQLSQNAYQRHFCWEAVAGRFAHLLNHA